VQNSEFVWIGDTSVIAWGNTNQVDGTGGDFPLNTQLLSNFFHENGFYTKQSAPYFQSKSAQTFIADNIFFNGPRSAININDGFGGGNEITRNLFFNFVRETNDHGPINSWDREPYLTTIANGRASFNQAYNLIHHNMFICNYNSDTCIDNDDGSNFFQNYNNFEVYGCHKDYYAGHDKHTFNSVLAYPSCWGFSCGFFTEFVPGYVDGMYDVSCIQGDDSPYVTYMFALNLTNFDPFALPYLANNKVYNTASKLTVSLGGRVLNISDWQAKGQDLGTKLYPMLSDDEIIAMGRGVLGI